MAKKEKVEKEKTEGTESVTKLKDLRKSMKANLKDDYVFLDEDGSIDDVTTFIPSGCTAIDYIMTNRRNGGYPVGKIAEISGMPASGKSLLAAHACANAQKMGGLCIFLDPENAFGHDFATRIGLNVQEDSFWLVSPPPPTVEALFSFIFDLSSQIEERKKLGSWPYKFVLIVWDSLAATPAAADLESENPDPSSTVALKPRIISKNLTTFLSMAMKRDICLLVLNQLRNRIGAMPGQDPYVTPGGNAVPFYASIRLRVKSIGKLKFDEEIIGVSTQVAVEKTRFGPPHRKSTFPIYFTHGIDDAESIIDGLVARKALTVIKGGSKGNLVLFEGQQKEDAIKKSDFKRMFLMDPEFNAKILDLFEKVMTRDLSDPRFEDVTVSKEE